MEDNRLFRDYFVVLHLRRDVWDVVEEFDPCMPLLVVGIGLEVFGPGEVFIFVASSDRSFVCGFLKFFII